MSADQILQITAGIALASLAAVTAIAVLTGRADAREGAETLRQLAVVRTRLGALVDWEQKRRGLR